VILLGKTLTFQQYDAGEWAQCYDGLIACQPIWPHYY